MLSDKAKWFLHNRNIILTQSFYYETKAYMSVLPIDFRNNLTTNIKSIVDLVEKQQGHKARALSEVYDVRQYAFHSAESGIQVCVVTADELLIERLLLGRTEIDVYDLNTDTLLRHQKHYVSDDVIIDKSSHHAERITGIRQGSQIYYKGKTPLTLSDKIGSGMEGKVFCINERPDTVAKIFKKRPSNFKIHHIEKLSELNNDIHVEWCLLPKELLYDEDERPIGFTMPKVDLEPLSNDLLYLGDISDLDKQSLDKKHSYTLKYCSTLLTQIKILNCFGISIPDLNDGNISRFNGTDPIYLIDTDSFVLDQYFGNSVDDICFSRQYAIMNKEQLSQLCDESALRLVFILCSYGLHPFRFPGEPYQFSSHDSPFYYRREFFPPDVIAYLDSFFAGKAQASLSVVLCSFVRAINDLVAHPDKDFTVRQMTYSLFNVEEKAKEIIQPPNTMTRPEIIPQPRPKTAKSIEPLIPTKQKKKHHIWPWVALLTIISIALYYLISQGFIQF